MHMQRLQVRSNPNPPQGLMGMGQGPGQGPGQQGQGQGRIAAIPQQTALQKLQEEKELLRQRQEELNRQVMDSNEMLLLQLFIT